VSRWIDKQQFESELLQVIGNLERIWRTEGVFITAKFVIGRLRLLGLPNFALKTVCELHRIMNDFAPFSADLTS
jgi:hypothetical protein